MVTSRDVAKKAKVSQATVSRVFSNSPAVSEKTKKKVLNAAKELNYSPNLLARSLKSNKSFTIGMIISSYNSIFYTAVAKRLEKVLKNYNYRLLITFSSENPKNEKECFESLVESRVDGIIFTPVSLETQHLIDLAKKSNSAVLQLYRNANSNIDSFTINDTYGTYLATLELLKNNHKDILLVDYKTSVPTHRNEGYIRAFQECNLEYDPRNICYYDSDQDTFDDLKNKIDKEKPTAIIAVTANTGLIVYKYLKEEHRRVPEDISLVVYDDSMWAQINDITTVSHPFDEIANRIGEQILELVNGIYDNPSHNQINPYMVFRKSIKKL